MITTVLILVLGSLAAGAGIGGGGLFVPIYMVLLGAGPKGAVPLSKATILGGASLFTLHNTKLLLLCT